MIHLLGKEAKGEGVYKKMYELGDKILTSSEIAERVKQLGSEITTDYKGKQLLVVGVLKGAVIFLSDLIRSIDLSVEIDFMAVSSYGASTKSSGIVKILKDLDTDIKGKDVLLVDDILDTGLTLNYLLRLLREREPASCEACVLLDKPERRKVDVKVKYIGFSIPDLFVVGYGLDYAGKYRNLPDIYSVIT